MSSNTRSSRVGQTAMTSSSSSSTAKRVRSNSPVALKQHEDEQAVSTSAVKSETVEQSGQQQQGGEGEEPVTRINIDNEEPIRLSKFSGGYEVSIIKCCCFYFYKLKLLGYNKKRNY